MRFRGLISDEGEWPALNPGPSDVYDAVRKLLGPAIAEHVATHVELAGRALGDWVRAAIVSQVLCDEGLRRYSDRRLGLVHSGGSRLWRGRTGGT